MAATSGGGAATSSGIGYQNRVAAYFIASAMCDADIPAIDGRKLDFIGFETADEVDDLKLVFKDGTAAYLQIKRKIFAPTVIVNYWTTRWRLISLF